jgi:hypothetical protein
MSTYRIDELFEDYGRTAGSKIALDAQGECVLRHGDGTECVINASSERRTIAISIVLGTVGEEADADFFARLLCLAGEPAATYGGSLGVARGGDVIVYRYVRDVDGLDGARLGKVVDNVVAIAGQLRQSIEALRTTGAAAPDRGALKAGVIRG